jgi:SagB-type dehydrogenase family enzyme
VIVAIAGSVVLAVGAGAWAAAELRSDSAIERVPEIRVVPVRPLPEPRLDGDVSFEASLLRRRATREFRADVLSDAELGQLLWAAQGEHEGGRNAPSAGALHPLELYVAGPDGVSHYRPAGHELARSSNDDIRAGLAIAALEQRAFATAPTVILIAGVEERSAEKYGSRAQRYVQIEVGHAAQNLLLQAGVLGIGAVPTGAFRDRDVADLFDLPDGTEPLYLIPVGWPA